MSDMVERVARAIYETCAAHLSPTPEWDTLDGDLQVEFRNAAASAIVALREPTSSMTAAAFAYTDRPDETIANWRMMIDVALK